jgi:hypothetical protein
MNDEAVQTHDQLAARYLQYLQALAAEIPVAMNAIAKNAITTFRESVDRQEMLCALLANLALTYSKRNPPSKWPPVLNDSSVAREIQATTGAVRDLNLQYTALLKHSGRSVALLLSLCRSHTGQLQEAAGPGSKHQTWSCDM